MKKALLAAAIGALLPVAAHAQFVTSVKAEPAQIQAGQETKITVDFDKPEPNCGLRLHFGDGVTRDFKINQKKDVPLVVTYKYDKAGEFRVMTEPKREGMLGGCGRKNMETFVKVAAAPAAAAPAAAKAAPAKAAMAEPTCPEGWTLDRKSFNKKTGAFTCTAKAGTKPPAGKLECPGDLGYFENSKKGQLGCRS
ncbi:MAG TPA: hypothetical protein VMU46_07700 [Burkholderiales bacterium]|nr:hypothetical protein [Burkholderiales bacterium]